MAEEMHEEDTSPREAYEADRKTEKWKNNKADNNQLQSELENIDAPKRRKPKRESIFDQLQIHPSPEAHP